MHYAFLFLKDDKKPSAKFENNLCMLQKQLNLFLMLAGKNDFALVKPSEVDINSAAVYFTLPYFLGINLTQPNRALSLTK